MKWLKDGLFVLRAYLPTIIVMLALVILFLSIPQVRSLFPTPGERNDGGISIMFPVFTVFTGVVFIGAFVWVIEPRLRCFWKNYAELIQESNDARMAALGISDNGSGKATPKPGPPQTANLRVAVTLAILAAVFLLCALCWPDTPNTPSWFEAPVLVSVALFLGFWTLYFLIRGRLPCSTAALLWRALVAATVLGIGGEVLWWVGLNWSFTSPRIYSIGAICYVAFVITIGFAFIDRWNSLQRNYPIRVIAFVVVMLIAMLFYSAPIIGTLPNPANQTAAAPVKDIDSATTIQWLTKLRDRINKTDSQHPVIFVASSGGGSRAALFGSLIFEALGEFGNAKKQDWIFDGSSQFVPEQQIVLVSSVSGGSLASACFTDLAYRNKRRTTVEVPANYDTALITRMMAAEVDRLDDVFSVLHEESWPVVRDKCRRATKSLGTSNESQDAHSFLKQQFVDDMCADFMAPLLRGVIHLSRERGEAVTWYWRQRFVLEKTPQDEQSELVPLWMCNATDVDSGRPFVIGFPPLPPSLIAPAKLKSRTFEPDVADWKLTKAEAVRLSANFPWGFDVPTSPLMVRHHRAAGAEDLIEPLNLIDGGVFDNSGMVTIRSVINSIRALADEDINPAEPQRARIIELARAVQIQLSQRGVILLEIDSGAKPEPAGVVSKVLPSVFKPLNALNNSAYHNSERISLDNTSTIQSDLRNPDIETLKYSLASTLRYAGADATTTEKIDAICVDNVHFVKLTCNEEDNVMTAWALPPDDKAKIFVRAMVEFEDLRQALRRTVNAHLEAKAIFSKISEEVLVLEQAMKLQKKVNRASIEKLADEYLLVANIITNLKLEQDQKNALAILYAQKATPEKYKSVVQEFSDLKMKLPMAGSDSLNQTTAKFENNIKMQTVWGGSAPNEVEPAANKVIAAIKDKPETLPMRSIELESDLFKEAKNRLNNNKKIDPE